MLLADEALQLEVLQEWGRSTWASIARNSTSVTTVESEWDDEHTAVAIKCLEGSGLLSGQDELAKYFKPFDDLKEGKEKLLEQIDQEPMQPSYHTEPVWDQVDFRGGNHIPGISPGAERQPHLYALREMAEAEWPHCRLPDVEIEGPNRLYFAAQIMCV